MEYLRISFRLSPPSDQRAPDQVEIRHSGRTYSTEWRRFEVPPHRDDDIVSSASAMKVGARLFESAFKNEVHLYEQASRMARRTRCVGLIIEIPERLVALQSLPWELLYDRKHLGGWLVDKDFSVIRSIGTIVRPDIERLPSLRVLFAYHKQHRLSDRIRWRNERNAIEGAVRLSGDVRTNKDGLYAPNADGVEIYHAVCHGSVNDDGPVLHDARGAVDPSAFLRFVPKCRMVFVNACFSGARHRSRAFPFNSFPDMLLKNDKADFVICNSHITSDGLALAFSAAFYLELACGSSFIESVLAARKAVAARDEGIGIEWARPVAYVMRSFNFVCAKKPVELQPISRAMPGKPEISRVRGEEGATTSRVLNASPTRRATFREERRPARKTTDDRVRSTVGLRQELCVALLRELRKTEGVRDAVKEEFERRLSVLNLKARSVVDSRLDASSKDFENEVLAGFGQLANAIVRCSIAEHPSLLDKGSRGLAGGFLAAICSIVLLWILALVLSASGYKIDNSKHRALPIEATTIGGGKSSGHLTKGDIEKFFTDYVKKDATIGALIVITMSTVFGVAIGFGSYCGRILLTPEGMIRHSLLALLCGSFLGLALAMASGALRAQLHLSVQGRVGGNLLESYARQMVLTGIAWAAIAGVVAGISRSSVKRRFSRSVLAALFVASAALIIEVIYDWRGPSLPDGTIAAFFLSAPISWGLLVGNLAFLLSRS
jgi:hypothetical protein